MTPCKFRFDHGPIFEGFALGSTWNGFDNVAVTAATLENIARWTLFDETLHVDDRCQQVDDYRAIKPNKDGLYSLANGYATRILDEEGELCAEFENWCDAQGLPQMSADELIHVDVSSEQRQYLSAFIDRWEAMMRRQGL